MEYTSDERMGWRGQMCWVGRGVGVGAGVVPV